MRRILLYVATVLLAQYVSAQSWKPVNYVSDYAEMLTDDQEAKLNSCLSSYEKETSVEIAVLTVESLSGRDIFDVAQEVFTTWGIGKKSVDDGVLILVSKRDKKWRIHTGYGVEEYITDMDCKNIGQSKIVPFFKRVDYYGGLVAAVSAIKEKIGVGSIELRREADLVAKKRAKERLFSTLLVMLYILSGSAVMVLLVLLILSRLKLDKRVDRATNRLNSIRHQMFTMMHHDVLRDEMSILENEAATIRQPVDRLKSTVKSYEELIDGFEKKFQQYEQRLMFILASKIEISKKKRQLSDMLADSSDMIDLGSNACVNKYKRELSDSISKINLDLLKMSENASESDVEKDLDELNSMVNLLKTKIDSVKEAERLMKYSKDVISKKKEILDAIDKRAEEIANRARAVKEKGVEEYKFDFKSSILRIQLQVERIKVAMENMEVNMDAEDADVYVNNYDKEIALFQKVESDVELAEKKIESMSNEIGKWQFTMDGKVSDIRRTWSQLVSEAEQIVSNFKSSLEGQNLCNQYSSYTYAISKLNSLLEEAKRKKRNKDEEEEKKRRRNIYSSSYSSIYSSSSFGSSGGSSFGGFGGGRSGGGGANGGW